MRLPPGRALLACGPALLVTAWLANGLGAGFGDADIHAALADPDAFPGDLLSLASRHPSLLWTVLPAPRGALLAAAICLLATGWAAGGLARELAPRRPGAWVVAAATTGVSWGALGGAPTLDPILVPRLAALPVELLALVLVARGRWPLAFSVAGGALCLHAPSAVAVLLFALGAWWPARRLAWWAPGMAGLGAGVAVAMVGTLGVAPMDDSVWQIVRARLAHHVEPGSWGGGQWAAAAAWAVAALVLLPRRLRAGAAAMLGGAALLGLGAEGTRSALLVNLEPWQAGRFAILLVAIALPLRLRGPWLAAPLAAALLLSPPRHRDGALEARQRALAAWAVDHTARGDLFVLPPHLPPAFRAWARRPVVGTWKDGGEAQFSPALARAWARRMDALCGCSLFADPLPPEHAPYARSRALRQRLAAGFAAQPVEVLEAFAQGEGARWLVLDREVPGALVVAGFAVLDLGSPDSEERGRSRLADPEVR